MTTTYHAHAIEVEQAKARGFILDEETGSYRPATGPGSRAHIAAKLAAVRAADKARIKATQDAQCESLRKIALAKVFVLAKAGESVEFRVHGDTVTVQTCSTIGPWPRGNGRSTLTLEAARAEYRRLLAAGYRPW